MVIKIITNQDGQATKLWDGLGKLSWATIGNMAGEQWKKYSANPCMASYATGEVGFVVISCFYGAGEAKGLSAFFQTLDKLDAVGVLLGKISKIGGKLIKPVLNTTGKAFKFALRETVQFAERIEFKLPNNLYCGIPYLEIKLRDRLKTLTADEIKKLEDDIARQLNDPAIPVDENANKLLELDIDGEKVPAVVGTEDGLEKVGDGASVSGAANWATAIGKNIDDLVEAPLGYQIFTKNGNKYIRRIDATDINTPRLMVDETGSIVKYTKPQRLANSTKLRSNLEKVLGKAPDNHQAHHLVPSNVVEKSALHKEAMNRGLYDVDRAGNGKFLAETDEDFVALSEAFPTHFGSHINYDKAVSLEIVNYERVLISKYGSVDKIPIDDLNKAIDLIENKSLEVLTNWKTPKLN